MRNSWFLWASLALPAWGLTLHERDVPAVIGMDIQRKDIVDPVARDRIRRKRDKTVGQVLDNEVCQLAEKHLYPDPTSYWIYLIFNANILFFLFFFSL